MAQLCSINMKLVTSETKRSTSPTTLGLRSYGKENFLFHIELSQIENKVTVLIGTHGTASRFH